MNTPGPMNEAKLAELARLLDMPLASVKALIAGETEQRTKTAGEWGLRYKADPMKDFYGALDGLTDAMED